MGKDTEDTLGTPNHQPQNTPKGLLTLIITLVPIRHGPYTLMLHKFHFQTLAVCTVISQILNYS